MGIRLVVIDDNPHVRWEGRVYPVNATFHRFLAALLDVPGAPISSVVHCLPLRDATEPPATLALDQRISVVGTAPFSGIDGYLRHAPALLRSNARTLRRAIAPGDLVFIKVPASNAPLAAWLAWRAGIPRTAYVAGSAFAVARGRGLGLPAQAVGLAYDLSGRLAGGRQRIVVGSGIIEDTGVVSSLVEPEEIRSVGGSGWPAEEGRLRLAWAGRITWGKGLERLLEVTAARVAREDGDSNDELVVVGEGPARVGLESRASSLGLQDRVRWIGYLAERSAYLDALGTADLFVFPSPAEGFPKVILDAMAVGLPVIATPSGEVRSLIEAGVVLGTSGTADDLGRVIDDLLADPATAKRLRARGHAFARGHTRAAEAGRLVARLQRDHPALPWDAPR